jgi:hypothetical protein
MRAIPITIYKYMKANKQGLTNLKSQILYMANPGSFNDPFDCAVNIEASSLTKNEVEKIRTYYLNKDDISETLKAEFRTKSNEDLFGLFKISAQKALDERKISFNTKYGVCCFSETKSNLLMWAHYAESFSGYCLEYFTNKEPFDKMLPVEYMVDFPKFDIAAFVLEGKDDQIFKLFCTKSKEWDYEKEWRVLHAEAGTKYHYGEESLKAIYFGPRMDFATKEIICLILKNQTPNVELWDSKLSRTKFTIDFEKVEYTSYIDAKKMGLR